ncbi:MAG TPA: hypothetical protein VGE29_12275 [Prosthecobacter sp.]
MGSSDLSNPSKPAGTGTVSGPVNPFTADVCTGPFVVQPDSTVDGLNQEALERLVAAVEARSGATPMLLTAPRAGYGKTHLLGRVAAVTAHESVLVPLAFRTGDVPNLTTVTSRGLEALSRAAGSTDGWSRLRELCAGLVAHLLHELIKEGLVPSANPEQALKVLSGPVSDVFDKDGLAHPIGDWLRKHSAGLRPVLARRLARQAPVRTSVVDQWLEAMLEQAFEGGSEGLAAMTDLASSDTAAGMPVWFRLLAVWRPVVLLVDHLDGYYRNPDAGVAIASLLMDMVEDHGVHVLLCLNQDVWQATFGHHLPSALEDRLTASQVLLRGLRETDADALLKLRLKQAAIADDESAEFQSFVHTRQYFLGRPIGSVSARMFLRHCARQWEVFQNSVPFAGGQAEASPSEMPSLPADAEDEGGFLIPTAESSEPAAAAQGIFDDESSAGLQQMAENLAEPEPALPQNEIEPEPQSFLLDPESDSGASEELPAPSPAPISPHAAEWRASSPVAAVAAPVSPASDAFVKLREMLHHLRQPGARPLDDLAELPPGRQTLAAGVASSSQPASAPAVQQPLTPAPVKPGDALLGRFETLRLQLTAGAESQALDYAKIGELIRLAGRRFPLVRLSEHELPGMTGRQTMVWSLQGVELLFGLASFADTSYWRVLAGFAAGRLADLAAESEREGTPPVKLKMVTFKADREHAAWQALYAGETIPDPLKPSLDAVHLDAPSVGALYAMQRIIKDAETGAVQAEPNQVMAVLARELDFFWKRITRA